MTPSGSEEIVANLNRSKRSIEAAEEMVRKGYYDFAASRAYYEVFYAATALLLHEDMEFSKHEMLLPQCISGSSRRGNYPKNMEKI